MKLSDWDKTQKLVEQLTRLNRAIEQMRNRQMNTKSYDSCISNHKDGSGASVSFSGCYAAKEIDDAIINVLLVKRAEVFNAIETLGVEIDIETTDE